MDLEEVTSETLQQILADVADAQFALRILFKINSPHYTKKVLSLRKEENKKEEVCYASLYGSSLSAGLLTSASILPQTAVPQNEKGERRCIPLNVLSSFLC
jgi:hypothetical protein